MKSQLLLFVTTLLPSFAVCINAPVVILPGLGGSVLESKAKGAELSVDVCRTSHEWEVVWLPLAEAQHPECILQELDIFYDNSSNTYHNRPGVEIRPHDYGGLAGVAALDPSMPEQTALYQPVIDALEEVGYQGGRDLFGSPYDFRLAADGLDHKGLFADLARLIERAVFINGLPAVLLTHSMGSLVALSFLLQQKEPWRQQHIGGLITMGGALQGSVDALKGSIAGEKSGAFVPPGLLKLQMTVPSAPWLFPRGSEDGEQVFVTTAGGDNYTEDDFERLLVDLGHHQQAQIYPHVKELAWPLPELDVPVVCMFGTDIPTPEVLMYDVPHFNASHVPPLKAVVAGDGDGTVGIRSLEACQRLGPNVTMLPFPNVSHVGMLTHPPALEAIQHVLVALQAPERDAWAVAVVSTLVLSSAAVLVGMVVWVFYHPKRRADAPLRLATEQPLLS